MTELEALRDTDEATETAPAQNSPVRPHCPNSDEADITKLPTSELLRRMKAIRDGSFGKDGQNPADNSDTYTDFAPPAGFTGWQARAWGDSDYNRSLNSGETAAYAAVKAKWAAEDEAEIAGRHGHDAGLRDLFLWLWRGSRRAGPEEPRPRPRPRPQLRGQLG